MSCRNCYEDYSIRLSNASMYGRYYFCSALCEKDYLNGTDINDFITKEVNRMFENAKPAKSLADGGKETGK